MDIERLRTLRAFADRGSVTAAAAALHCTPSAVSQQIRALQAEVGVPLTEPAGRGLRLTDAGQALVARADEVLAAVERAEHELDTFRSAPRGRVRVAMFPSVASIALSGLLRRIDDHDGLEIDVRDVDMAYGHVPGLVADFDLVIAHRDETTPRVESERLEVTPLLREPLDVALPVGHRLSGKSTVNLAELAGERWISVDLGFSIDDALRALATHTDARPRIVQRINDFRITEILVAGGHGIALLPRHTTDDPHGRLVRKPLAGIRAARYVEAVSRIGASNRPAVAAVLGAIRAELDSITAD